MVDSDGYTAYQHVVKTIAELRAQRSAFRAITVEDANFERGVLFAYRELYDVVETILSKSEEVESARQSRNGEQPSPGPRADFWGSAHYTDLWRR